MTLFMGIAGASGSGKTTIARYLIEKLGEINPTLTGIAISTDDYYKNQSEISFEQRVRVNYDNPKAIDSRFMIRQLTDLRGRSSIEKPTYDFVQHTRSGKVERIDPVDLIILEGIFALVYKELNDQMDYRIFVRTHPGISVARRIERDVKERGRTVEQSTNQIITQVIPGYEEFVKPTEENANFSINWNGDTKREARGLYSLLHEHFNNKR